MKRIARRFILLVVATALGIAPVLAQGTPTMSNPRPRPVTTTLPTVTMPTVSQTGTGMLYTGRYQLRLQATSASGTQVTTVADVNVVVNGTAVHVTTGSSSEEFSGTVSASQLQLHGVAGGATITLVGAPNPSGVSGSLTTQDATNTVHGTFALTAVHATQLHKIEQYGTKSPAAPERTWGQIWHDFWSGLGL